MPVAVLFTLEKSITEDTLSFQMLFCNSQKRCVLCEFTFECTEKIEMDFLIGVENTHMVNSVKKGRRKKEGAKRSQTWSTGGQGNNAEKKN